MFYSDDVTGHFSCKSKNNSHTCIGLNLNALSRYSFKFIKSDLNIQEDSVSEKEFKCRRSEVVFA